MANTKKITEDTLIRIRNNTKGSTSFVDKHGRKQVFPKTSSYKDLEFGVIRALYNDSQNFIEDGYVVFDDLKVYEELQIPEEIYSKLLPIDKIKEFLEKNPEELEAELKEMNNSTKEKVAMVAKELEIDSKSKLKAIKNATGFDAEKTEFDK